MKNVTITDVAKLAGVSKSTVSQYLNKRFDYMSEDTKQRIESAIKELGYQTNFIARSLKQKRTSTIGVIVANILHNFSTQIIRAIEDVCNEHDFHVIVCNADDDPEKEKKYINMLRAKQVDGIIAFPTGGNTDLYEGMIQENYPLIFVDRLIDGLQVDAFLLDNKAASKLAVQHFAQMGHKHIGIITTSLIRNVTPRVERIAGYMETLKEMGLPNEKEYAKGFEVTEIKRGLEKMLSLDPPPTAILAGNDLSLMEILNYTKNKGLKIPDDFSLIGIDDVSFANIYYPPLTTIAQPVFEMGTEAANLLIKKIKSKETSIPKIHRFKPELIVRESVKNV